MPSHRRRSAIVIALVTDRNAVAIVIAVAFLEQNYLSYEYTSIEVLERAMRYE